VSEAKRREARSGVGLVANAVAGLLGRGAVVAQAVGLDDQAEIGPEEVDAKAADDLAGKRERQAGGAREGEEPALELGVGEREGGCVEQVAQHTDARRSREALERPAQRPRRDQSELVGFVHGALELPGLQPRRQLDERARRRGHLHPGARGDSAGPRAPMDAHAGPLTPNLARDRDLDWAAPLGPETPQSGALPWLSAAPGSQLSTAAIRRPLRVSSGRPTA